MIGQLQYQDSTSAVTALIRTYVDSRGQFRRLFIGLGLEGASSWDSVEAVHLRIHVLAFASFCFLVAPCFAQERATDTEIQSVINSLSSRPLHHDFEIFYRNPERATEFLIEALKPTAPGHHLSDECPQAVWIVRALRSLTGLDFKGNTEAHLDD
jgi:hypothetical protein